jgi:hypothetical protein
MVGLLCGKSWNPSPPERPLEFFMPDAIDHLKIWLAKDPAHAFAELSCGEKAPWSVRLFQACVSTKEHPTDEICVGAAEGETLEAAVELALIVFGQFQEGASR